jgi:hypothetical protein
MMATLTASPMTVQVLALIAAVLFLIAAIVALIKPTEIVLGLIALGGVAFACAVIYTV